MDNIKEDFKTICSDIYFLEKEHKRIISELHDIHSSYMEGSSDVIKFEEKQDEYMEIMQKLKDLTDKRKYLSEQIR